MSKLVDSSLFEGDYRVVAEKALGFWRDHDKAPGQHIADLFSDILEDKDNRRAQTFRRIMIHMFEIKDAINAPFVLQKTGDFNWLQRAKAITIQGAEHLDSRGISAKEQFVDMWRGFLREGVQQIDAGLKLHQVDKVLDFLAHSQSEFKTGVKELDENNIVPMRGKLWLLVASAKKGKTWGLIQVGKHAFMQRKKVLHVSLEIEAEEVAQRYYQALFGASKREDTNKISVFKFDRRGALEDVVSRLVEVPFTFASTAVREELVTRINHHGIRASNIVIKRFPMSSLTFNQFEGYLESLEAVEHFVPDIVILDYPKIMKLDTKELRVSLGQLFENLRGLAQRRNFALCAVHQTNRAGVDAEFVKATHASEDWSVICTADFVVTYSQTSAEKERGLARLFVDAARSEADKFGVLITQSYKTGQFVLESTKLSDAYAKIQEGFEDSPDSNYEEN